MKRKWKWQFIRAHRTVLAAAVLSCTVLSACLPVGNSFAFAAVLVSRATFAGHSQEQEEAVVLYASLDTRTHMVTAPAVLTMDVVSSGGSGLYSYQWSVQYDGADCPKTQMG